MKSKALYAADIVTDYACYDALVDEFLAAHVSDFGIELFRPAAGGSRIGGSC